jgi:hypothetical protein
MRRLSYICALLFLGLTHSPRILAQDGQDARIAAYASAFALFKPTLWRMLEERRTADCPKFWANLKEWESRLPGFREKYGSDALGAIVLRDMEQNLKIGRANLTIVCGEERAAIARSSIPAPELVAVAPAHKVTPEPVKKPEPEAPAVPAMTVDQAIAEADAKVTAAELGGALLSERASQEKVRATISGKNRKNQPEKLDLKALPGKLVSSAKAAAFDLVDLAVSQISGAKKESKKPAEKRVVPYAERKLLGILQGFNEDLAKGRDPKAALDEAVKKSEALTYGGAEVCSESLRSLAYLRSRLDAEVVDAREKLQDALMSHSLAERKLTSGKSGVPAEKAERIRNMMPADRHALSRRILALELEWTLLSQIEVMVVARLESTQPKSASQGDAVLDQLLAAQ